MGKKIKTKVFVKLFFHIFSAGVPEFQTLFLEETQDLSSANYLIEVQITLQTFGEVIWPKTWSAKPKFIQMKYSDMK